MKLSVSVADDKWQEALDASAKTSPSAVVSDALTALIAAHRTSDTGYAHIPDLPEDLIDHIIAAKAAMREHLRGLYTTGYLRGAKLAAKLNWVDLQLVNRYGAKEEAARLEQWLERDLAMSPEPDADVSDQWALLRTLHDYLDYQWSDGYGSGAVRVDPVVSEGIDAAVRAFYNQVTQT